MLQLAIFTSSEQLPASLPNRLRHVAVRFFPTDGPAASDPTAFDSAVILYDGPHSQSAAQAFSAAGKPVLWAAASHPPAVCHDAKITVVNPDRFLPSRQLIKQQLEAGKLGDVGLVRIHRWSSANGHSAHVGFASLNNDLDTTLWYFNKRPSRVYALNNAAMQDPPPVENQYLQVHLGFPAGGMALIVLTNRLPASDGFQSLTVIGSSGAAYADDHANTQLVIGNVSPARYLADERSKQVVQIVQSFADAVRNDQPFLPEKSTSMWLEQVTSAIGQSLRSHQAVALEGA